MTVTFTGAVRVMSREARAKVATFSQPQISWLRRKEMHAAAIAQTVACLASVLNADFATNPSVL